MLMAEKIGHNSFHSDKCPFPPTYSPASQEEAMPENPCTRVRRQFCAERWLNGRNAVGVYLERENFFGRGDRGRLMRRSYGDVRG